MSEYDNHEPLSEDQLLHMDLLMAEDAGDFCALHDELVNRFNVGNVVSLPEDQLGIIIETIEDHLRNELEASKGLTEGRHVGCKGFGAYMLGDAEKNIKEGRILSTKQRLYGTVFDICVMKVPSWPAIMAEGKEDGKYEETLSPCIILRWPNVIGPHYSPDAENLTSLYAYIPLVYGDLHFESVLGKNKGGR